MEEKNYKNGVIYTLTVVVSIIIYLVIHLFGDVIASNIVQETKEYEKSISKQPVNHIISIIIKDDDSDKTPPTAIIEGNKTLFEGTSSIEVCAICTDNESGCVEERVCKIFDKSASGQTITVYDKSGNMALTPFFNVIIKDGNKDTTPPTAKLEDDKDEYSGTGKVTVCAICKDSGSGCVEERVCRTFTNSATNQKITVYDNAGNKASTHVFDVEVKKDDTTPPTINLEEDKDQFIGTESVTVCAICTDSESGCVKERICKTYTETVINQRINGYDNAGNEGKSPYFDVVIKDEYSSDKTPPNVRLENDSNTYTGTDSVTVCAICTDSDSGCVEERVCKTYTETTPKETITVYDNAGNEATTHSYNVEVKDGTPPNVRLEDDKNNYSGTGSVTVCAICTDSGSGCVEERVCKTYTETTPNQTITVYDKEGNHATTHSYNVEIIEEDTTPPNVRLENDSNTYTGTGSVTVCAICTDSGSGCVEERVCKTYNDTTPDQTITVYDNAGNHATTHPFDVEIEEVDIFVYLDEYDQNHYINLINQFPISDEVGRNLEGDYRTFDFKLKLKPQAYGVNYVITVEKLDGSNLPNDWIKTYLDNEGTVISNCLRPNGRIKTFNEYSKYQNRDNERILYEGTVTSAEATRGYKNFTYKMWISEDVQVNNQNYESRLFKTRINVYATKN